MRLDLVDLLQAIGFESDPDVWQDIRNRMQTMAIYQFRIENAKFNTLR